MYVCIIEQYVEWTNKYYLNMTINSYAKKHDVLYFNLSVGCVRLFIPVLLEHHKDVSKQEINSVLPMPHRSTKTFTTLSVDDIIYHHTALFSIYYAQKMHLEKKVSFNQSVWYLSIHSVYNCKDLYWITMRRILTCYPNTLIDLTSLCFKLQ